MFDQTVTTLLEGEFICGHRFPHEFHFLSNAKNANDVSQYLGRLNMDLAKTREETAWYLVQNKTDALLRRNARRVFTDVKQIVRPLVLFIELVMQATNRDDAMTTGARLSVITLTHAISQNPSLRNQLQRASAQLKGSVSDTSLRSMVDKIIKRLKDDKYLVQVDTQEEIYQVTAKIEYFEEVVEYLMDHEKINDTENDEIEFVESMGEPLVSPVLPLSTQVEPVLKEKQEDLFSGNDEAPND